MTKDMSVAACNAALDEALLTGFIAGALVLLAVIAVWGISTAGKEGA